MRPAPEGRQEKPQRRGAGDDGRLTYGNSRRRRRRLRKTGPAAPKTGCRIGKLRLWKIGVQRWTVDLDRQTATSKQVGYRQLSRMAGRVDVGPIADELAGKIASGEADVRLSWLPDGRVRVEMGKIFPDGSGFRQTVEGHRRRLSRTLIERLSASGWNHLGRSTFGRTVPPTVAS